MRTTERPAAPAAEEIARRRDVNVRGVMVFAFWLAVGIIAAGAGMLLLLRAMEKKGRASEREIPPMIAASLARTPPEPRLEPYPLAPRAKLRAEEDAILTTYGWVDKDRGLVRVPIDRAMELLVERGLPPAKPMSAAPPPSLPGEPSR